VALYNYQLVRSTLHLPAHFTLGQEKKRTKRTVRPASTKKEQVKRIIYMCP